MNEKIVAIINPASGSADENFRSNVESELRKYRSDFEVEETDPENGGADVAQKALRDGARHLIACGGDGTVMSIVNGVGKWLEADNAAGGQSENPKLSIVPGGTANLLAGALSVPTDIEEAVEIAVGTNVREIDLGRCQDSLFALGIGLGLTERLVSQTSAEEKEKIGKLAYAKAMLLELGVKPTRFTFKLENGREQQARGVAVVIANAGQIGGGLSFAPDAKMDDGLLDLCILHRFYFRDVLRMAWHSLTGHLPEDRAVSFFQAKHIEIHSEPPLDLQVDGEVVDITTPLIAEVRPNALLVTVPVEAEDDI